MLNSCELGISEELQMQVYYFNHFLAGFLSRSSSSFGKGYGGGSEDSGWKSGSGFGGSRYTIGKIWSWGGYGGTSSFDGGFTKGGIIGGREFGDGDGG